MTQRHCDSKEILLHFDGEAEVEELTRRTHICLRWEDSDARIEVFAYDDAMILRYHSAQQTKLSFREGRKTLAHVEDAMGLITLQLQTDRYEKTPEHIHVRYSIVEGAKVCDTFEFQIEMGGGRK